MVERYIGVAAFVALGLGLVSRRLRDLPLSEPLVALAIGAALGPAALGLLEMPQPHISHAILLAAKIALALAIMSAALRFPPEAVRRAATSLVILLGAVLPVMALVCAGVGLVVLSLPAAVAWLLGAAIAPTDPVLAGSVVTGEPAEQAVPERLRLQLSIESAANDGLAFALVALGVHAVTGDGVGSVLLSTTRQLAIALVCGATAGVVVGRLLRLAEQHRDIEHSSFLVLSVLLALAVLGLVDALGGQALLGVFTAGLAYNVQLTGAERRPEWEIEDAVNRYLVLPVFVVLGASLPWSAWVDIGWEAPLFAGVVLLLRRLPAVLTVRRRLGLGTTEALFLGWFGPIGVAAVYYLTEALERDALSHRHWSLGVLVVVVSTVVHGITSTPGRKRLARTLGE